MGRALVWLPKTQDGGNLLERGSLLKHGCCGRVSQNMGGTTRGTIDASSAHGLSDNDRDGSMRGKAPEGGAGTDKQSVRIHGRSGSRHISGDGLPNLLQQIGRASCRERGA